MRFIYTLIVFATFSVHAQSPTWRLFHPGDVAYYKPLIGQFNYNDHYAWYTLDSLPTHKYTRYFFHKNLMGNTNDFNTTCIADNTKGWAGIRADVTDTSVVFYNRHELPILFKTNTKAGDKWPVNHSDTMRYFFEHVRDTVEEVINSTDSVRWYNVKKTGSDEELYRLALSKHHGMWHMFNVWHFLDFSRDYIFEMSPLDYANTLILNSRKSIPGVLQNFNLWECYPYQPGDEVHEHQTTKTIHYNRIADWDSSIIKVKYINRTIVGDSVLILKRELHTFKRELSFGRYSERITVDTQTIQLPKNTDFDREPGYPIYQISITNMISESKNMFALNEFNEHAAKSSSVNVGLKGDGPWCVTGFFADGSPERYDYIKGIGIYLLYNTHESSMIESYSTHIPFYYKQGGKTWGTPYPFTLGEREFISAKRALMVYPNPSNATINFSFPVSGTISIADMSGKIVYSREWIQPQSKLDTDLPEGVYVIEIRHDDGAVSRTRWVCIR